MLGWTRTLLLLLVLHVYIGVRLLPDLPVASGWKTAAVALLALMLVFLPLGMTARSRFRAPLSDRITWMGMTLMSLFSSLFVFTLLRDVFLLATVWFVPEASRMGWLQVSALAVVIMVFAVTLIGFVIARRRPPVKPVRIPLASLPTQLDGFSIVQITDLHVGPTIKRGYVQAIVDVVNQLQPDVIALTGDFVDGSVPDLQMHIAPLGELRARHGVYMVLGNHEYYAGEAAWTREFRRLGFRVLINEHVVIERGAATLVLAGVTDFSAHHFNPAHRSDPALAVQKAPADALKVLLAHQPRSAPAAVEAGFQLQLSGHTHGGQFWPWVHFVRMQQPFTAGLHRLRDMYIYISRGVGYWGPPNRFGAPSEISHIRLVRG